VSGLLRAYRGTVRVFEAAPCHYCLTDQFPVDTLAAGDLAAADTLEQNDAIAWAVPWVSVHDRLLYHHDATCLARRTRLPHQVGTVADRRCHHIRFVSVPRSEQAPLDEKLAQPQLEGVAVNA